MPFQKGKIKTGGRKPGSKNKVPSDLKSRIAALIDDEFDTVQANLSLVDPKDHVSAIIRLIEFVLPKQREQKVDVAARLEAMSDEQLNALIDQILKEP